VISRLSIKEGMGTVAALEEILVCLVKELVDERVVFGVCFSVIGVADFLGSISEGLGVVIERGLVKVIGAGGFDCPAAGGLSSSFGFSITRGLFG
jgi:hypothetical protein